jgi:hypothetical protein
MEMNEKNNGNLDIETTLEGDVVEDSSSEGFFNDLEQQVNGQIQDVEAPSQPETQQVTQMQSDSVNTGNENIDWKNEADNLKQRYADSSREAQKLKAELNQAQELTKFRPLIEHLKNDPSAVEALRGHISGQTDVTTQFGEDFVFDAHEAVTEPGSDSAKVLKQMIDTEADKKVSSRMQAQAQQNQVALAEVKKQRQFNDFVKRTGMNDQEMQNMQEWASKRELTMDDIHFLMNKENAANNVANNTKQEMLGQMRAVRNIPASASNANSAPDQRDYNDTVFDVLKGLDDGAENLFG